MLESPVPILVAVHGQCLGGGLELALAGSTHRSPPPTRELGQPGDEARRVRAGGLLPAARALVGPPPRIDLLISGRSMSTAAEARGDGPGARASPQIPRPRRSPTSMSTCDQERGARSRSPCSPRASTTSTACGDQTRRPSSASISSELMQTHDADEGLDGIPRKAAGPMGAPMSHDYDRCDRRSRHETLRRFELRAAREWKAAQPGRKVVGYMPIYVPREIIHAAGMLPLGIFGGGDQLEVIHGDAYYQSYICRIPRSTVELGLTGRLDCVDGMLFPSICDVIRNLSGMWKILFPDECVRYFDVPQNYRRRHRRRLLHARARRAARRSRPKCAAAPITDDESRASIAVYNENRRWCADLYAYRAAAAVAGAGRRVLPAACAPALVLPVEEHTALLRDYLAAAARRGSVRGATTAGWC